MFRDRRRRAASNPSFNASNASPSATTAAAQAFLKNQSSSPSLSAAAAAAALKARPTTPTSVADVQTKRTLRRSGSTSSIGSSAGSTRGPTGSQLERRGSSGSMSERTFRDPSPARAQPVPSAVDAPPVPAIPKNIQQGQPPIPPKSHRRAASLEAMRVASPPPHPASGRGSSLGPGASSQPRRAGHRVTSLSSVQELTGLERPASRGSVNSINFSLPTSTRPMSPVGQRRLTSPSPQRAAPRITSPTNQNLVYDPNTRSFLPAIEVLAIEQRIYNAANKPVKKKKKIAPNQATGTHLAGQTVNGRPRGTAVDAMEAASQQSVPVVESTPAQTPAPITEPVLVPASGPVPALLESQTATVPKRKKKKRIVVSDSDSDQGSSIPYSSDTDSDISARPATFNTRAGARLGKKPSIVREDREREEEEDDTPKRAKASEGLARLDTSSAATRTISPTPLPRSVAGRGHGRGQALASGAFAEDRQDTRSASQPAPSLGDSLSAVNGVGLVTEDSVRSNRVQSVSPARTTHFATTPDNLVVKHQPPPRSISPRKSALKRSNSPRGPSPGSDVGSAVGQGQLLSEGSNASTAISDELAPPKKKANRVSFDETNVVVGQAVTPITPESPVVQSPQTKRPWYSIGRGKKKETAVVDDDDEIMKPRPALPSFGSIREKKPTREVEERPLVKPAEPVESKPPLPSPPILTTPTGEVIEHPLGPSNDHAVGAVISQDAASKNAANISKSREPLPPQVTSVEGSGYHSDSDSSDYSLNTKSDIGIVGSENVKRDLEDGDADTYKELASHIPEDEAQEDDAPTPTATPKPIESVDSNVPEIAILHATPTLDALESRSEWPHMPGAWDNSASDSENQQEETPMPLVPHRPTEPSPAEVGIAEPTPEIHEPGLPALGEIAVYNAHTTPAILQETEESDASIYSDAAEDLSDIEGDGFLSLDAVVESPVVNTMVPGLAITTPPDSPISKATNEMAYRKNQSSKQSTEPDLGEGWDKAQEYWSGLSAEKKKQLELEAHEDAEGSDTEVEIKPTPRPKRKKKKVAQPSPDTSAVRPEAAPNNERSYMIRPGAKAGPNGHAVMRSSMRAEPQNAVVETHMRKSMRGGDSMRGSLRGPAQPAEPKGSLQKKHRPMSYLPVEIKANPAEVKKHIKNLSEASAAAAPGAAKRDMAPPVLRRKSSGDSESSFKRTRPSNEGSNLRRSVRGSGEQEFSAPNRSRRFSLRSLSPTGSAFRGPFNSAAPPFTPSQTHMRSSMRNSSNPAPSLRTNNAIRMPGFGRPGASKPSKSSKQKAPLQRLSRFADSSDEEDDRPTFRSRFGDSSDEDEPISQSNVMPRSLRSGTASAPVRGIPKHAGAEDGDSSDLSDSDDEKPKSPGLKLGKKRGTNGSAITPSSQGATLAAGSLRRSGSGRGTISSPTTMTTITGPTSRPSQSRGGGFMSILRRKKPDPTSKVRKSDAESPARRDTPLERSKSDLAALRADRPSTPRLQKRNPPSRENSGAWPLSGPTGLAKVVSGEDGRPFTGDTADGVVGGELTNGDRPDMGTRRFTATGLVDVDMNGLGAQGKAKKKKKFGALRRMFRLDD